MTAAAIVLAAVSVGCVLAVHRLSVATWPRRSPAAAIALWQALGLAWGIAAVGCLAALSVSGSPADILAGQKRFSLLVSMDPQGVAATAAERADQLFTSKFGPTSWNLTGTLRVLALASAMLLLGLLCWILFAAITGIVRARHRQRILLRLLAHGDPKVPGALVVDHPAAAAYCLPGLKPAIVISAGTLNLLDQAELAAVLAHERAHLKARHDLVLLPFTALLRGFSWSAAAREANQAVALLVEMLADDQASKRLPARQLARALLRVSAAGSTAPAGALAADGAGIRNDITARVTRLLRPQPGLSAAASGLSGAVTVTRRAAPVIALILPL